MTDTVTFKNYWFIIFFLLLVIAGCKNQQKLAEEQARIRTEHIAQAKEILNSILNDDGQMTVEEMEQKLRQAKALNADDPEVQSLIAQVEDLIASKKEPQRVVQQPPKPDMGAEEQLNELFAGIANAPNPDAANTLIARGLEMFSSREALVLIIISKSGDIKDYDQPTTIDKYLNYLKDQRTSSNAIYDIVKDGDGKISELELIKKSIR